MEDRTTVAMRVRQWLIRCYPICPKCNVKMQRDSPGPNDKLLGYYECPKCKWRTKSRDRVEDQE